jgi:hypothetical protein
MTLMSGRRLSVRAKTSAPLFGAALPSPLLLAAARTAIGVAVLARPTVLARGLRVDSGTARRTAWLARLFAGREIALGASTLIALTRGRDTRLWLAANAVTDAMDSAALALAVRHRQVGLLAAAAGIAGAATSTTAHLAACRTTATTAGGPAAQPSQPSTAP